jgi:hypothetical protein
LTSSAKSAPPSGTPYSGVKRLITQLTATPKGKRLEELLPHRWAQVAR